MSPAMKSYVDFELEIERAGRKRYRAKVIRAPRGRGAQCSFDLPSEEEMGGFQRDLASDRSSRHLEIIDRPRRGSVEPLGRRLFERAFAQKVRDAWRASLDRTEDRLRLRLHLEQDPRLLAIPWELLFDPERGRFVATERPVVRTLDIPSSPRPLAAPEPLRMLAVLSCPPDVPLLEIEREWSVLDQALGEKIELKKSVPPTLDEIDHALRGFAWHVLHFVGHGHADENGGFLFLESQEGTSRPVDHIRLGTFLGHESLRLVVLNACEGARPGRTDPFSGVAQALLTGGVPAVVAMQQVVSDAAAIAFAKAFYGAVAGGQAVDEALLEARRALYRQSEAEWVVPVLYLNAPDGELIKTPGVPPPRPKRWPWFAGGMLLLLLLFGVWMWPWQKQEQEELTPPVAPQGLLSLQPPRSAAGNPPACPSPPDLNIAFVRIPAEQPFCLGAYEVTQELWDRVMGNPETPTDQRYLPVQNVTFDEAQQFLTRLNQIDPTGQYRLPADAEWEHAARAGTRTRYSFGNDRDDLVRHANCRGEDRFAKAAPVGQFKANPWGLHDMYGNVFEWVSDREGEKRVRRGGGWDSSARSCSSGYRSKVEPERNDEQNGFRIVREIQD